jgi:6-pyruvoyltetrahydropterin/6-carboxytetrahydropterin synthase
VQLTRRYRFAAAHRLDTPALSPEQNRQLYGKCNNPFGHGHDYIMDITVQGEVNGDGLLVDRATFDRLIEEHILQRVAHRNLNVDLPEFHAMVSTTENLADLVRSYLQLHWTLPVDLVRVRISETDRNTFTWQKN